MTRTRVSPRRCNIAQTVRVPDTMQDTIARSFLAPAISVLLVLVVCASPGARAFAQTPAPVRPLPQSRELKALSLQELGNVQVVSTTKQPDTLWRTASATYVITQDDIRRSGATTLPDVLRLAPGVIVSQSDSNRWAVGVRGFADVFSKNVLVLIDGRSVYTPLNGGVHWAIQDVLLADVEQIEVVRGPGGSIWGANALNGVINIITKSAEATHGAHVQAATGLVEEARVSARYGDTAGAGFHYRFYGKAFDRGPQFHEDGADFDRWHSVQGGFRADWGATLRDTLTISGDVYRTRTGERADISLYAPVSAATVDGELDLTGGNAIVRWQRQFAGGARSRLQAYYDRTRRDGFTFREVRDTLDVDFNVRLAAHRRHEWAWGAGARFSPSTVTPVVPTLNFLPNEKTHTLASAFVQDDISVIADRVSLSLGLKVEHNNYTGLEVLPSARLLWTPRAQQSVWAAITRAVRTPSRFERDLSFQVLAVAAVPIYVAIAGNPDFQSETVLGFEVGYRTLVSDTIYLDVAGFTNDYGRLAGFGNAVLSVETAPITHLRLTLPFENSIEGTTRGVEIAPTWRPLARWQLKGSYSYLQLSAENEPGFTDVSQRDLYLGRAPRHQVRVQSGLDLPGRVEFDQTYRFVDALRGQGVDAYHGLDSRVGWQISDRIDLSVVGRNLLQSHHREFSAVPVEIRRSVYVQLGLTR